MQRDGEIHDPSPHTNLYAQSLGSTAEEAGWGRVGHWSIQEEGSYLMQQRPRAFCTSLHYESQ